MMDTAHATSCGIEPADDAPCVLRIDDRGRILSVNAAFVESSGFSAEELIGAPYDVARHPDTPEVVGEDLWRRLRAGRSWDGVIKNRRKNGDPYWTRAMVTPVAAGAGGIAGCVALLSKPTRSEVDEVERLYALLRRGVVDGMTGRARATVATGPLSVDGGHRDGVRRVQRG